MKPSPAGQKLLPAKRCHKHHRRFEMKKLFVVLLMYLAGLALCISSTVMFGIIIGAALRNYFINGVENVKDILFAAIAFLALVFTGMILIRTSRKIQAHIIQCSAEENAKEARITTASSQPKPPQLP
jgi:hypothetical protein